MPASPGNIISPPVSPGSGGRDSGPAGVAGPGKQQIMLPTRPVPIPSTQTPAANSAVQSVKLPTSPAAGVSVGRTIATTTLTGRRIPDI